MMESSNVVINDEVCSEAQSENIALEIGRAHV